MKRVVTTALLLALSTGAFAQQPGKVKRDQNPGAATEQVEAPALEGKCNAEGAKPLLGRKAEGGNVEQARVLAGADSFRILRPGDTGESYAPDPGRLNIRVDVQEVMIEMTCG